MHRLIRLLALRHRHATSVGRNRKNGKKRDTRGGGKEQTRERGQRKISSWQSFRQRGSLFPGMQDSPRRRNGASTEGMKQKYVPLMRNHRATTRVTREIPEQLLQRVILNVKAGVDFSTLAALHVFEFSVSEIKLGNIPTLSNARYSKISTLAFLFFFFFFFVSV